MPSGVIPPPSLSPAVLPLSSLVSPLEAPRKRGLPSSASCSDEISFKAVVLSRASALKAASASAGPPDVSGATLSSRGRQTSRRSVLYVRLTPEWKSKPLAELDLLMDKPKARSHRGRRTGKRRQVNECLACVKSECECLCGEENNVSADELPPDYRVAVESMWREYGSVVQNPERMPSCRGSNPTIRIFRREGAPSESADWRKDCGLSSSSKRGDRFVWGAETREGARGEKRDRLYIKPLPKPRTLADFFPKDFIPKHAKTIGNVTKEGETNSYAKPSAKPTRAAFQIDPSDFPKLPCRHDAWHRRGPTPAGGHLYISPDFTNRGSIAPPPPPPQRPWVDFDTESSSSGYPSSPESEADSDEEPDMDYHCRSLNDWAIENVDRYPEDTENNCLFKALAQSVGIDAIPQHLRVYILSKLACTGNLINENLFKPTCPLPLGLVKYAATVFDINLVIARLSQLKPTIIIRSNPSMDFSMWLLSGTVDGLRHLSYWRPTRVPFGNQERLYDDDCAVGSGAFKDYVSDLKRRAFSVPGDDGDHETPFNHNFSDESIRSVKESGIQIVKQPIILPSFSSIHESLSDRLGPFTTSLAQRIYEKSLKVRNRVGNIDFTFISSRMPLDVDLTWVEKFRDDSVKMATLLHEEIKPDPSIDYRPEDMIVRVDNVLRPLGSLATLLNFCERYQESVRQLVRTFVNPIPRAIELVKVLGHNVGRVSIYLLKLSYIVILAFYDMGLYLRYVGRTLGINDFYNRLVLPLPSFNSTIAERWRLRAGGPITNTKSGDFWARHHHHHHLFRLELHIHGFSVQVSIHKYIYAKW